MPTKMDAIDEILTRWDALPTPPPLGKEFLPDSLPLVGSFAEALAINGLVYEEGISLFELFVFHEPNTMGFFILKKRIEDQELEKVSHYCATEDECRRIIEDGMVFWGLDTAPIEYRTTNPLFVKNEATGRLEVQDKGFAQAVFKRTRPKHFGRMRGFRES